MDDPTPTPKKSSGIWKFWLGLALFVAFSIAVNMEAHSPEGRARAEQGNRRAIGAAYEDSYASCRLEAGSTESQCREQSQYAAELLNKKLPR
jgi:hypothetical protein